MKKKLSIFLIIAALLVTLLSTQRREKVFEKQNLSKKTEDKIHFLNVGAGDCILLESNGKFALIDSGEDAKSIRFLFTNKKGYVDFLIDYIKISTS